MFCLSTSTSRRLLTVANRRMMATLTPPPRTSQGCSTAATVTMACGVVSLLGYRYWWNNDPIARLEQQQLQQQLADSSPETIVNWSGTHTVETRHYWEPSSVEEVEEIIRHCHQKNVKVRPVGSALSPNALSFQSSAMMGLCHLDEMIHIDKTNHTVTVQAGARVSQVIDALRPHGYTLPNLASIAEQQMGGFVQVGAHGTGRAIAPVDHYVRAMKIVTPGLGTIQLSEGSHPELFQYAKVGLGLLGVVVEVTMDIVPAHYLLEHTFVLTRQQAKEQLDDLLQKHKHMRYMWIPYADAVVCVTNDPVEAGTQPPPHTKHRNPVQPLTDLMASLTNEPVDPGMGFGELRDGILAAGNPLDVKHVQRCNQAEAAFWKNAQGYVVKPSDELLQFDCGGQQWVWEVCFPTGTQEQSNGNDMKFIENLLDRIETLGIPAHSPIEQRWSASSCSPMSPAHGTSDGLHSWVGIINYIPNESQRAAVTEMFTGNYCDTLRDIGEPFSATSHWAKLERPPSIWKLVDLRLFLESRFPIQRFNEFRDLCDPCNILSNDLLDAVLGKPEASFAGKQVDELKLANKLYRMQATSGSQAG